MFHILLFIIVFLLVYLGFKLIFEEGLKRDRKNVKEIEVAKKMFDLDGAKVDNKELLNGVSIVNAFIISTTFVIVDIIGVDKFYWLLVALVVIIVLIIICYSVYGKILHMKWGNDKDDKKL